jgi:hypothetical protein
MAKYQELPTKPRVVEAVQFTSLTDQVPTFNEPMPQWLFQAFLTKQIEVGTSTLILDGSPIALGSWIVNHGTHLKPLSALDFIAQFKILRKKPVRKPKVAQAVSKAA